MMRLVILGMNLIGCLISRQGPRYHHGCRKNNLAGKLLSVPMLFFATHENSSGLASTSVLIGRLKYKNDFLPP